MALANWMMRRGLKKAAAEIADWAVASYVTLHSQHPELQERELFGKMLDQRLNFPGGSDAREQALDVFGSSINGICYYCGLNTAYMKQMMVIRRVQFTEYVDIELENRGFTKPLKQTKEQYFKVLGLPEDGVRESWLFPA